MPRSVLLAVMLSIGLLALCAMAFDLIQTGQRRRQQRALLRFSGRQGENAPAGPGTELRRDQSLPGWLMFLPAGLTGITAMLHSQWRRAGPVLMLLAVLTAGLLHLVARIHPLVSLVIGTAFAAGAGLGLAHMRELRRLAMIDESLPEAMDMIVRSLRVGLPVGAAIRAAGQDLSGPLASEFAEAAARISYGQEPVHALRDMADRSRNQGLRFFAAAVGLQSSTGGNLAEVLERLAAIARSRQQLQRKIRSITAEAKWSGRFLSAFPLIATGALLGIKPDYFAGLSGQPVFKPMLAVVGLLLLGNILFMRWLVRIE